MTLDNTPSTSGTTPPPPPPSPAARRMAADRAERAAALETERQEAEAAKRTTAVTPDRAAVNGEGVMTSQAGPTGAQAMPDAPGSGDVAQDMAAAEPVEEERGGLWGFVDTAREKVADGVRAVGDAGRQVLDKVGDAAEGAADAVGAGLDAVGADGAAEVVRGAGDGIDHAADKAGEVVDGASEVVGAVIEEGPMGAVNLALDTALGPVLPAYAGQLDGVTGAILNRLAIGDAVFLRGKAGLKVNVAGYVGGSLTGQVTVQRNTDGTISVSMEMTPEGEAGVSAKTGAKASVGGVGIGASATAEAGVVASGTVKVNMRFNPSLPEDAARLKALLEPTPDRLVAGVVNPLALVAVAGPSFADAVTHNLESVEGGSSVGIKAGAKAGAQFGPAAIEAGAKGEAVIGMTHKYNKDGTFEQTFHMSGSAKAEASATVLGSGVTAEAGAKASGSLTIVHDAEGKIIGISNTTNVQVHAEAGARVGLEGTTDGKDKAKTEGDTRAVVKETRALSEKGMAIFHEQLASGKNPLEAYHEAAKHPDGVVTTRSTTVTDSFTLGVDLETTVVGFGGAITAEATVGKSHTDTETLGTPDMMDTDMRVGPL